MVYATIVVEIRKFFPDFVGLIIVILYQNKMIKNYIVFYYEPWSKIISQS